MKKIIFLTFICISILIIYCLLKPNKNNYLILGISDNSQYILNKKNKYKLSNYNSLFLNDTYRITDLLNDINNKKQIKDKTILNYIIKADYITINIGYNDFKLLTDDDTLSQIEELTIDLDKLFKKIRLYSKEEISFLKFNIDSEYNEYINKKIKKLCENYNILYIEQNML